jgi:hypothetical protein
VVAQRPRDRDAVVAVLHEVDLADAVEVDGRHRLAAAHRRRDALPAGAHLRGGGPEVAVEAALAVDGAHDRVQRHDLAPRVALLQAAQRVDDLLEREDVVDLAGLAPQPAAQPRQRQPPARAQEVVLGVGAGQSGAARRHTRKVLRVGRRTPPCRTPCAAADKRCAELAPRRRKSR